LKNKLKLVKCKKKYWEFVRKLRIDERVIAGFIKQNKISKKDQEAYMIKRSMNFRICLCNGEPAGFVRVIEDDISVCTHPSFQKKGIGKFMINQIQKEFENVYAKIKIDNTASKKLFESCGFELKYFIYEPKNEQIV